MLNLLINYFEKGDTQSLANAILHTGFWQQHQYKAYGHAQINELMARWLNMVGRCNAKVLTHIDHNLQSLYILQLTPRNSQKSFVIALDVHHNTRVIKSIRAVVDTYQAAVSIGKEVREIGAQLPNPEPLVVSDYDHQNHLQSEHLTPSMLLPNSMLAEHLDRWWRIWTVGQLSEIDHCYSQQAYIRFPDSETNINTDNMFLNLSHFRSQFKRTFCQLESIVEQDNRVIVFWYFEGDETGLLHRERIVFCSVLEFANNQIIKDILITDLAAHFNRYPASRCRLVISEQASAPALE